MKAKQRIKLWEKAVQYFRNKQQAEINFYKVWGFSHHSSKKKIEKYIEFEKKAIKRLLLAIDTYQTEIEFKKGFYNTMLKESRPNIKVKDFELENTDL